MPGARAGQDWGVHQAEPCSASCCPSQAGHLLSHPWDTPCLPRDVGHRLAPRPRKVSAFHLPELRALCPPLRFLRERGCSLRLGIQPFPLERGFPHLAFVSSSLLGTPSRDGPEAGEERTFPGSRFPPSRKPCVPCISDFVALYLGNIPLSVKAIGGCCRA